MKATVLEKFGSIHDLKYKEVAIPEPAPGEVLVKVHYAAINPYDLKVIEVYGEEQRISLPVIPGSEISGIVEKTGSTQGPFETGDPVCGYLGKFGGCFAPFAIASEKDIIKKPGAVSFEIAAATPVAALTAWKAVFETAELKAGQKILIHGGAGNVGSVAVQLAKSIGAYVIATASGKNEQRVKGLGADLFIDYTSQHFSDMVSGADVVIDLVGGKTLDDSFSVLKPGGQLVSLIEPPSKEKAAAYNVNARMIFGAPNPVLLQKIMDMIISGQLKISIDKIFRLSETIEAFERMKTMHSSGKILLMPG